MPGEDDCVEFDDVDVDVVESWTTLQRVRARDVVLGCESKYLFLFSGHTIFVFFFARFYAQIRLVSCSQTLI